MHEKPLGVGKQKNQFPAFWMEAHEWNMVATRITEEQLLGEQAEPQGHCAAQQTRWCHRPVGKAPFAGQGWEKSVPPAPAARGSSTLCCWHPRLGSTFHDTEVLQREAQGKHLQQSPAASQNTAACGWRVCQTVWSCQNIAAGKGDARQQVLAADNSNQNRPWLCAAAVPKQVLWLILFGEHDSLHTTGML